MTGQGPDDGFDAFERRLAARVQRHADRGVRPFDAAQIARDTASASQRGGLGRSTFGRLAWVLGTAAVAVVAFAGGALVGDSGLFVPAGVGASPSQVAVVPTVAPSAATPTVGPVATPAPTAAPIAACAASGLSARVTGWSGAAGSRVASVTMTNTGSVACRLRTMDRPELVDGDGHVLIEGAAAGGTASLVLRAGASVRTQAEAANYCGADPVAPVSVAFVLNDGTRVVASPRSPTDTFGVPPCLGSPAPATITMHPWAP